MAIEFEFYQSPDSLDKKTKKYYPKVVNYRTVNTQELAEEIHSGSTLTTADIVFMNTMPNTTPYPALPTTATEQKTTGPSISIPRIHVGITTTILTAP